MSGLLGESAFELCAQRSVVEFDLEHARDAIDVGVVREQCGTSAPSYGGDHAIEHPTWGDACGAAATVDPDSAIEVANGIEAKQRKAPQ